jgi:hypothetical protein
MTWKRRESFRDVVQQAEHAVDGDAVGVVVGMPLCLETSEG